MTTARDASGLMPSWRELREHAERALGSIEAQWIVEEASGRRGAELLLAERRPAPAVAATRVERMVARRVAGEPLQYVLGSWSFMGHDVMVDGRVLIPRPETEVTAQVAIDEAVRLGARMGRPSPLGSPFGTGEGSFTIADLGTGSGVIALTLAATLRDVDVWATDVSEQALAVARANLAGGGSAATRVRLARGDWFDALPGELRGRIRMVVTNPPYVAEHEVADLPAEVADHEPRVALVSGRTGLEAIRRVVGEAPDWLEPTGTLVCEISSRLRDDAVADAREAGFADVTVLPDMVGRDRVLVARRR